jgi:hypothetical protein
VWGNGPNDVWAVGSDILHWNGTAWSSSTPAGFAYQLGGVWGSAPSDVWVVGRSCVMMTGPLSPGCTFGATILHWDGRAWSVSPLPVVAGGGLADNPGSFTGVWGTGPSDVWAGALESGEVSSYVILHWDGSAWSASKPLPAQSGPGGIWGSGPNDVWAVAVFGGPPAILHWDGSAWSSSHLPSSIADTTNTGGLAGVWGSGPCDVWAVGFDGTILHHP